ncbi:MAG: hypothetical protein GY938_23005 [Ketobacter sp.]|nr:hypothetical protein [Ketobacter sp.]
MMDKWREFIGDIAGNIIIYSLAGALIFSYFWTEVSTFDYLVGSVAALILIRQDQQKGG